MATTVRFHEKTATISSEKWHCSDLGFAAMLDGVLFDHQDDWITGKYLLDPDLLIAVETIAFVGFGVIISEPDAPDVPEKNEPSLPRVY